MKVLTVLGARPQFVKASVVSRAFLARRPDVEEIIVHTGQHFDFNMSQIFFDDLGIPCQKYNLGIGGGSHGQNTGRMLVSLESVMIQETPDMVLVYGDTDSTLAGALAASKIGIPVAHVEAGLRSFNRNMPEEINRVITDHISGNNFAPTATAVANLKAEGIPETAIGLVGDVMYDAILYFAERAVRPEWFVSAGLNAGSYSLATIHRAENTNDPGVLASILAGLGDSERSIVMPIHPRTRDMIQAAELLIPANVYVVSPVGYLEMLWLQENSELVVTDSGGLQKEAFFQRKPCVILREETEWIELIECGWSVFAGTSSDRIAELISSFRPTGITPNLFGDGDAARKIVDAILS